MTEWRDTLSYEVVRRAHQLAGNDAGTVCLSDKLSGTCEWPSPNRLFVALADKALRRHGRMIAAGYGMDRSRLASECIPFGLPAAYGRDGNFRVYTPTAA